MQKSLAVAALKDPDPSSSRGCLLAAGGGRRCRSTGCSPLGCHWGRGCLCAGSMGGGGNLHFARGLCCLEWQSYRKGFVSACFGQIVFQMVSQDICSFYLNSLSIASYVVRICLMTEETVTEHCSWSLQCGFFVWYYKKHYSCLASSMPATSTFCGCQFFLKLKARPSYKLLLKTSVIPGMPFGSHLPPMCTY